MISRMKYLLASTALLACLSQTAPSFGDTVVRETVTESPGGTVVNKTVVTQQPATVVKTETTTLSFTDFDARHDGVLSMNEVGKALFKVYDADGNGVIDNNEYERHMVVTIAPMEKTTITSYSIDDGGVASKTKYTRESFMRDSRLSRFDAVKEGVSAHDFVGRDFMAVDVNRDHAVDLKEWQGTYISSIDKKNKTDAETNK